MGKGSGASPCRLLLLQSSSPLHPKVMVADGWCIASLCLHHLSGSLAGRFCQSLLRCFAVAGQLNGITGCSVHSDVMDLQLSPSLGDLSWRNFANSSLDQYHCHTWRLDAGTYMNPSNGCSGPDRCWGWLPTVSSSLGLVVRCG
jgi:hypothetical protein